MIVIVADDEGFVRNGIIKHVPWNTLGISTVIEAKNGLECLEKAEKFPPDIIIADIKMPRMNGIDLGRAITEKYPNCKIIIISAYSDKDYLKSAISLDVVAYVEKPLDINELVAAINKAKRKITELQTTKNYNSSRDLFGKLLTLGKSREKIPAYFRNIPNSHQSYFVAAVVSEGDQLKENRIEEYLESYGQRNQCIIYTYRNIIPDAYILLFLISKLENNIDIAQDFYKEMFNTFLEEIFISIGSCVYDIDKIPESLMQAEYGLAMLFIKGYGEVVWIKTTETRKIYQIPVETSKAIMDAVRHGKKSEVLELLDRLWTSIAVKGRGYTIESIKQSLGILLERIVNSEKEDAQILHFWDRIASSKTLADIIDLYDSLIQRIMPEETIKDVTVKNMLRIIREEYSDKDLSISYMCDKLNVSKSKICRDFRNETGKSINEYITDYRIKKAKKYLKENCSLEDIAELVGYRDANYFSKTFRKVTGMTPTYYRECIKNDKEG